MTVVEVVSGEDVLAEPNASSVMQLQVQRSQYILREKKSIADAERTALDLSALSSTEILAFPFASEGGRKGREDDLGGAEDRDGSSSSLDVSWFSSSGTSSTVAVFADRVVPV